MTDRPAIKPLEWFKDRQYVLADTPFGTYRILKDVWWFENGKRHHVKDEDEAKAAAQSDFASRIRSCLLDKPEAVEGVTGLIDAAEAGWNACRRQVYLLSEDYIERTHPLKGTDTVEGNFYRGQYDVAKSFAKAFSAFEARDCDYFKQIDFAALSTPADTDAAQSEIERLRRELEEARKALEPFAKRADRYNDIPGILRIHDDVELWQVQKNKGLEVDITVGDLRTARAALRAGEEGR
ncbi:hypothetical protein [Sinorhizobium meliloti]|uniref:hypothetical protein n=1 Tax=Rhizobium meliloti TaxID=382 RepID=UPI000FDC080D|nr:hypothetical protein [Sinorhizobium meliloti]RVI91792.1 hypothetical protein CN190_03345 [Sinorhizobium meliloti]